ncbi:hypothetical protein [Psychrobacillus sp.]|uniref:hypothetical protein n=1 Tax=Psychrobacillus sp. TaxID=1871623 RepID=UPI0028BD7A93|nr:hypothetical protein [Psychrobacillus sp.]
MLKSYGKVGGAITFLSLFLLILGVRYVLGQDLVIMNFIAFAAFSVVAGAFSAALLFYNLRIGFYLFAAGLAIGFIELFRSFIVGKDGFGDLAGILSLFIATSFGLFAALLVEGIRYILKMNK